MADGETRAASDFFGRFEHDVRRDAPVERHQYRRINDGFPHASAEHKVEHRNQTRLLEHDVSSQHDGTNAGVAAKQHQQNVDRQC
ncbi:Uncharacterised protein [Vibrio cholerae]|nr:Uncharacterised protein [Vibrio cholerae]